MGLLSKTSAFEENIVKELPKVDAISNSKESNTIGLLKRTETLLSKTDGLDFFDFITKYNFLSCALFVKYGDHYIISNSIGFDGLSIITSLSSVSFWEGTIEKENFIYKFSISDDTLSPFYQFLSKKQKETVAFIYIIKSNSKILFVCENDDIDLSQNIIKDLNLLNSFITKSTVLPGKKITISTKEAVEKYVFSQNILSYNFNFFKESISNAIFNKISCFFKKDKVILTNSNISIDFNSNGEIPLNLLKNHIKLNLQDIIGEYTDFLEIEFLV